MHQDWLAHQVTRQAAHHLDGVVVSVYLDVPRVRAARSRQVGPSSPHPENEGLCLAWPLHCPWLYGRLRLWAQIACARARTCSRVTFMLCDSLACFCRAGTISSAAPRNSIPHSHRTTNSDFVPLLTTRRIGVYGLSTELFFVQGRRSWRLHCWWLPAPRAASSRRRHKHDTYS